MPRTTHMCLEASTSQDFHSLPMLVDTARRLCPNISLFCQLPQPGQAEASSVQRTRRTFQSSASLWPREAEAADHSEFEASLVYIGSFRTATGTQRNPGLENKNSETIHFIGIQGASAQMAPLPGLCDTRSPTTGYNTGYVNKHWLRLLRAPSILDACSCTREVGPPSHCGMDGKPPRVLSSGACARKCARCRQFPGHPGGQCTPALGLWETSFLENTVSRGSHLEGRHQNNRYHFGVCLEAGAL